MVLVPGLQSLLLAAVLGRALVSAACRGPPYLYITYHGGSERGDINNVRVFSRDGCYLGEALQPGRTELNELRGMVEYGDSLFVNNANKDSSMVIQYRGACAKQSLREMRVVVPSDTPGIDHPYGLAVDNQYLYTTNQGTNNVMRFRLTTGEAADIAPGILAEDGGDDVEDYPRGLFHQFDPRDDAVRGIAIDRSRGLVYVANKDEGVLVLDQDGYRVGSIDVDKPIGLAICAARDSLLVGSKGDDTVLEYSLRTHEVRGVFSHKHLKHPAGLACHEASAFVVSQDEGLILEIDLDGDGVEVAVDGLDDLGEQLLLSHGNEC